MLAVLLLASHMLDKQTDNNNSSDIRQHLVAAVAIAQLVTL